MKQQVQNFNKKNLIMKLKYIKLIICAFLAFNFTALYAQESDVCVQVEDVFIDESGNVTPGSISVTVNNLDFGEIAFLEVTSSPCATGKTKNLTISDPIYTYSPIYQACVGEYCFLITHNGGTSGDPEDDCEIEVCAEVNPCVERVITDNNPDTYDYVTIYCYERVKFPEESLEEKDVVYLSGSLLDLEANPIEGQYTVYTDLNYEFFQQISNKIYSSIESITNEILTKGTSKYDIAKQTDIITEDDFVFKYNAEGKIEWVWHKDFKKKTKNNQISQAALSDNSLVIQKIYPNPFNNEFTLEIESTQATNVQLMVYDVLGSQIVSEPQNLEKGNNVIRVITNNLSDGMYLLEINDVNGNIITEKIFHKK